MWSWTGLDWTEARLYTIQTIGVISQERLKIEVKLLLSANRKSYMPRRLAQQRMTLSDLEWPFYASRAISAVAELLVYFLIMLVGFVLIFTVRAMLARY